MSLKALANKVLERDSRRDTGGTSLSQTCPTTPTPVGQDIVAESASEIDTLAFDERAAIVEFDGEIPTDWAEGLARLCTMPQPSNVSARRWRQAVDAAGRFADSWAAKASALGWTALDIFGVDRLKPEGALHTAGLIWLLQGKVIVAISDDAVIVETGNGARQSYRPRQDTGDMTRRILLWELDGS